LATTVVYPTPPQSTNEESIEKLKALIEKYDVDTISIGNGTASKESEIFVCELLKHLNKKVNYAVVNEAGASVYSASKLGAQEFPDFDVSLRSAVSIARRLQDPMAELIKIDVKSIGVGQYQHDMPQARLGEVLEGVVEDCVNSVGVDINTASPSLLSYVSGLNSGVAKNICEYRKEIKQFTNRQQLLKVPKLGNKAFEQCAGFLRVVGGDNVFDNTAVHPESYDSARKLLAHFSLTEQDVKDQKLSVLPTLVEQEGEEKVANQIGVGVPTLKDMISELIKPGRDIRDSLPPPILRSDLLSLEDLKEGMIISGTVRNVIDFGAFIDIGVHQDGLVHISQICDRYIKHPSEVLKVGDNVEVKVLSVDVQKKRISLTMRGLEKENKDVK
ncbi:MAG: helix-hairpin-helix domain-containing protein, partial [Clostridia bacterium]|nr:helix-hairpin-helix domain-containing protein [Clostridia bacterium]